MTEACSQLKEKEGVLLQTVESNIMQMDLSYCLLVPRGCLELPMLGYLQI